MNSHNAHNWQDRGEFCFSYVSWSFRWDLETRDDSISHPELKKCRNEVKCGNILLLFWPPKIWIWGNLKRHCTLLVNLNYKRSWWHDQWNFPSFPFLFELAFNPDFRWSKLTPPFFEVAVQDIVLKQPRFICRLHFAIKQPWSDFFQVKSFGLSTTNGESMKLPKSSCRFKSCDLNSSRNFFWLVIWHAKTCDLTWTCEKWLREFTWTYQNDLIPTQVISSLSNMTEL